MQAKAADKPLPLKIQEECHLWRGLASCTAALSSKPTIKPAAMTIITSALPAFNSKDALMTTRNSVGCKGAPELSVAEHVRLHYAACMVSTCLLTQGRAEMKAVLVSPAASTEPARQLLTG